MTARRRRALASALGALAAVLCAVLSSNVGGTNRAILLVLTLVWLLIGIACVASALRTAGPAAPLPERTDEPA